MKKWEYRVVSFLYQNSRDDIKPLNDVLDIQGKEGWELVSTTLDHRCVLTAFFKREIVYAKKYLGPG